MIDVDAALAALSMEDKCRLLAGETTWRTKAYPAAGVPQLKMSDGPNGVRGEGYGGSSTPGVVVPSGITLGATWDPDLLHEIGSLLGTEAIRKGVHVLLGPTINLHRTPVGGRTFECYSEDPELTGVLAAAYIRGVQSHEVAVTVKHFVCNDTEVERITVDVDVDERTLRELYLRPFELSIKQGGAWGVMSAYNKLHGEHCAENRRLLTDILRDEWGFEGIVVSDWYGVHNTAPAANAGLNVEMPAPVRVYGRALEEAVDRRDVDAAQVDRLVGDMLEVMNRTKADERVPDVEQSVDDPTERALTRRAAIAGTVLLRNGSREARGDDGVPLSPAVLPFDAATVTRVAVIGPNASMDRSMGGGSANLTPFERRSFLRAITERFGPETKHGVEILYEPGVRIDRLAPIVRRGQLRQPDGGAGLLVTYMNGTDWYGAPVSTGTAASSLVGFFGGTPEGVDSQSFSARVEGSFIPDTDGLHTIGVVTTGPTRVTVGTGADALVVVDDPQMELPRSEEFFGWGSVEVTAELDCTAGVAIPLEIMWSTSPVNHFAAVRVGVQPPEPADLMDRAVEAAAQADIAIVVVGTNDEWETEGHDRKTMDLPGRQDELVRKVVAANPRTAVVVNAGSPVTMDWADDGEGAAPAVLTSFFAGQEQADGLVDVLFGIADPGGRLPVTYPVRFEDTPAYLHHQPDHNSEGLGTQRYGEGLFIGYRYYESRGVPTRFPFGHGLSFGTAVWHEPTPHAVELERRPDGGIAPFTIAVPIECTSARPVTAVVQGYVAPPSDGRVVRPVRELKAWTKVVVEPGTTTTATLEFTSDAFHHWDTTTNSWIVDPGWYVIWIAESSGATGRPVGVKIT